MKKIISTSLLLLMSIFAFAQVDKDQLSLDVSKAEAANTEALKSFIWKRNTSATVDGQVKATVVFELSFNDKDSLIVTEISSNTTVKQKPGVRGKMQQNTAQDNMDYVGEAMKLAVSYTYMSKGQMIDFFDKATLTESGGVITASASDVYMKGDSLTIVLDSATKLFISKKFSSLLGTDPISGVISYAKFTSGVNHVTTTVLNLPAKKAVINAANKDYSQRIQ